MRAITSLALAAAFHVYRFILTLDSNSRRDNLSSLELLSGDVASAINDDSIRLQCEWIRRMLRRFPFWQLGHKTLGNLSLEQNDIQSAYSSAHAVMLLGETTLGERLLGFTYVRAREGKNAIAALANLLKILPNDFELLEELGAAYMLEGDYPKAKEYLEKIPKEKRSPSVNAVIRKVQ